MSVSLALLMAVTAAILAVAVCGVLWGKWGQQAPTDASVPSDGIPKASMTMRAMDAPPPHFSQTGGSLWTTQLEVGQTFHIQTHTAKYALTLRDPITGTYDAVRVGPKRDGKVVEERFPMLFRGTFVPDQGLQFKEFIIGGNLVYQKIRSGEILDMNPSTPILRILFTVGESLRQAS